MTSLNISYGSATAVTCTTTSLASDSSLLAGRQSNIVDNSTALADDALLGGTIATTGTITANTVVELWLFGLAVDSTQFSASAASTGDANFTPATLGVKNLMSLGLVIQQTDTTARTYTVGPISVAQAFGGVYPQKWGFYIVQNTGATLGATTLKYVPVTYTNA